MSHFDVLIHLRRCENGSTATDAGLRLAARLNAHVLGLHAVAISSAAFASPEAVAVQVNDASNLVEEARKRAPWWQQQLDRYGVSGEYQVLQGDPVETLCHASRWSDFVVIERPIHVPDAPTGWGIVSRTVFGASAPVVVVPETAPAEQVGENILIAWNASRESNLAIRGALPLLTRAKKVTVLEGEPSTNPFALNSLPNFDLRAWLERRGIHAEFKSFTPKKDHGPAVLDAAHEIGADTIVIGAWGRSRITELVLGGVTRHLFQNSDLPLLVAH